MSNFPCKCVTRFKIFLWLIIYVEVLNAVSISCHLVLKAFRYQKWKKWRIGLFSTENYSKWIFFPHFCFQRWEYFLMWSYAIIVSAGALQKTKLSLATVERKSILCLLWNSLCLLARDILHGWELFLIQLFSELVKKNKVLQ